MTAVRAGSVMSAGRDRALSSRDAYDLLWRLCRDAGGGGERYTLCELHQLATHGRHSDYSRVDSTTLARRVLEAVDRAELLVLHGWQMGDSGTPTHGRTSSAGPTRDGQDSIERRVVSRVMGRRQELPFQGAVFVLIGASDWAELRDRGDFEIVRRDEASATLLRMAPGTASLDEKAALSEAAALLADTLTPRLGAGLLLARRIQSRRFAPTEEAPAVTPSALRPTAKRHWIEFSFQDVNGQPIVGAAYRIILPSSNDDKGRLDGQGRIRHDDQPNGTASVELADIDGAAWSHADIDAHDSVDMTISTSGVNEGEAVTFDVFRLYRERAADVVATLHAKVDDAGAATCRWSADQLEATHDQYVFKATVAGAWRKSEPISVHRRSISAEWHPDLAREGEEVALRANLRGIQDGAKANVIVFEKLWQGGPDVDSGQLQSTVTGGVAEARWAVPDGGSAVQGTSGRREFYFTVEAGSVHCTSGLLVVLSNRSDS